MAFNRYGFQDFASGMTRRGPTPAEIERMRKEAEEEAARKRDKGTTVTTDDTISNAENSTSTITEDTSGTTDEALSNQGAENDYIGVNGDTSENATLQEDLARDNIDDSSVGNPREEEMMQEDLALNGLDDSSKSQGGTADNRSNVAEPEDDVAEPEDDAATNAGETAGDLQADTFTPKEETPEQLALRTQIQGKLNPETGEMEGGIINDPSAHIKDIGAEQTYTTHDAAIEEAVRAQYGDTWSEDQIMKEVGRIRNEEKLSLSKDMQVDESVNLKASQVQAQDPALKAAASAYEAEVIHPAQTTKAFNEIRKADPLQAASMATELNDLLAGMEKGEIPLWARPAVAKVEQQLAARGISASSIGRDALFNSIISAAMPIAQQDAKFKQETNLAKYNAQVNALMSDAGTANAALQFNATSKNQAKQFNAQMKTEVDKHNTNIQAAIKQFNVGEANAMTKFKEQAEFAREQFNAQAAQMIEQSNVNWRRQVNSANTAGINAANQANAQNAFNLSNQGMSFLWQEMRDQAHFNFQGEQNDLKMSHDLQMAVVQASGEAAEAEGEQFWSFLNTTLKAWTEEP